MFVVHSEVVNICQGNAASAWRSPAEYVQAGPLSAPRSRTQCSQLCITFFTPRQQLCRWIGGIMDPHVGRANSCMHARPERRWTLQALAEGAGRSRAVFATIQLSGRPERP